MDIEQAPQIPLDQNHSRLHPTNLIMTAINGLARLETWRRQGPERIDSHFAGRSQRQAFREAGQIDMVAQSIRIEDLRLSALVDPGQFTRPLHEALNVYHLSHAERLGAYASALETEQPPFARARRWFTEKRQGYHQNRAQKAANILLNMGEI